MYYSYYGIYSAKKFIQNSNVIEIEFAEINSTLSEDEITDIKALFTNANWNELKQKYDISTTNYFIFDDELMVGILEAKEDTLLIKIGRKQYMLDGITNNIYSLIGY